MKIFYDTEFIERGHKYPIELISIGMVREDGETYYAISTEFNKRHASQWVKDNVLQYLPPKYADLNMVGPRAFHESFAWKSRKQIAQDLISFCGEKPTFYAWYADYDHVVLCQLFGAMINLPDGWPMYTQDIKQFCDNLGNPKLPTIENTRNHHALDDAVRAKEQYEWLQRYAAGNDISIEF